MKKDEVASSWFTFWETQEGRFPLLPDQNMLKLPNTYAPTRNPGRGNFGRSRDWSYRTNGGGCWGK